MSSIFDRGYETEFDLPEIPSLPATSDEFLEYPIDQIFPENQSVSIHGTLSASRDERALSRIKSINCKVLFAIAEAVIDICMYSYWRISLSFEKNPQTSSLRFPIPKY